MLGMSRREFLLGTTATITVSAVGAVVAKQVQAADLTLPLSSLDHSLMPGRTTKNMMSFSPNGPPPVIRLKQGVPTTIDVINNLDEPTTVHWHGLRHENSMDGVPYLTQPIIRKGESFRYVLNSPDAGTFWYHPHCNTLEQMGRGLTGMLVVEDAEDPGFDQDLPLNIRDFRLNGEGQFIEFYKPRLAARGGTLGTVSTINWQTTPTYDLPAGSLVRLRLAVTDVTRVATYALVGGNAELIALDSNPLPRSVAPKNILLSPGQRADIALRVPDSENTSVQLIRETPNGPKVLANFRAVGVSANRSLQELKPLQNNPIPEPDIENAEIVDFVFGWSPGGDAPLPSFCGTLGYTFWSINRKAWPGDTPSALDPLAVLKLGKSYILRLRNETPNDHPIHLHGMSFRILRSNKREVSTVMTDTALLRSNETMEVALVADNPGNWVFHCHVIEHQKTGLTGYIRVEA